MEDEIAETKSPLDDKEEESDEQREEEWSSYPSLPSNESNSLTLALYDFPPCLPKEDECYIDCDDPMDSFEISLFDEVDAFYTYGHDATTDDAYKDELAIVHCVKHEICCYCTHTLLSYYPFEVSKSYSGELCSY